ncbi:MAG: DUF58 domain-containing protein [Polyangiales bacterium]
MIPTRRLFRLLLAGLPLAALPLAFLPAWIGVAALWAALGIAIALELRVLATAHPIARLVVPSSAGVGGTATLVAEVDNRSPMALLASLRAEVSEPLVRGEDVVAPLPPGRSQHRLVLSAPHRGRADVRAVWMRTQGPFGLVERIDRFDEGRDSLPVVPDAARVRRMAIEHLGAQAMLGGLRKERWAGEGGEFESLQSYVQGMDLRSVDWKASARHQSLRVRRHRLERRQRVVVAMDTGRLMADPIEGMERLDHAVHTSLLLARAAIVAGDLVGLHAYGAEPRAHVPPGAGVGQLGKLRVACAGLLSEDDETNHVLGLRDLLRRLTRRSLVVVFTEFTDTTTAELMIEHVGHLARKHVVIFVALDDPVLEEPLGELPREPEDLAAAVVAGGLSDRRRLVLARLRKSGVHVIHARPGRAAGELLDRYLQIKRRGLIG